MNQQLWAIAKTYHELGIPVIPFYIHEQPNKDGIHDKENIGTWKKWETEQQTDEEFNSLHWEKANAVAVLLGTKTKNGHYLGTIDHDTKGEVITPEVIEKARKILSEFPTTKITRTINKGLHYEYLSKTPISTDGTFHDEAALELLGEKKLCVMAGLGYTNVGSDIIAEVESLDELFHKTLKRHGFSHNEETELQNQQDTYSFDISKLIDLSKLENKGNGQYQGSHPLHDSTTEKNFCVDTKRNAWFCFRHNSGGGVLQYLAMKEGKIKCEQAKKGALRGKKFKETLELAVAEKLIDEKVLTQSEINPIILAKDIMEDHIFVVDKEADELYYYVDHGKEEGIYSNKTKQLIRREITARLDENFKARYQNEVTEFILGTAPLVEMGITNPELLAVKNGILNVITMQLENFDPKYYIVSKLPVTFNPEVKTTVWKEFIEQVITKEIQRQQVKQLIGHTLISCIETETCLILLGGGSNGKTIFLLTITKFLGGSKNVSSHSIQALCYDKFVVGEIKGKLANICADLPHKELLNTANFKALTSGDSIQGYIKHVQKTVPFIPTTKYIFSANQIPPVANEEDCYAWYRRFVFADFDVTFTPKNSIPRQELLAKLSKPDVFSEILNWALEGLAELKKNGEVTNKPEVETVRLQYIKRSDSALAYFADKVKSTNNPNDYMLTDIWFRDYVTYCNNNNLKPKTQGEFVNAVKRHLPGAEKTRIRPEYTEGESTSNALSAFRYVKVVLSVSNVSTSENKGEKEKKNGLDNYSNPVGITGKNDTSGTSNTNKKRLCVDECFNFDKSPCPYFTNKLTKNNPLPLKCDGYKYIGVGEFS
jgi:P4 family phage/plasmid primase-like protien